MNIDISMITKSINEELTQEAEITLDAFRSRLGNFPIISKAPVTLHIRNEENATVFIRGTVAVSYTHLDVYKRQDLRTASDHL